MTLVPIAGDLLAIMANQTQLMQTIAQKLSNISQALGIENVDQDPETPRRGNLTSINVRGLVTRDGR